MYAAMFQNTCQKMTAFPIAVIFFLSCTALLTETEMHNKFSAFAKVLMPFADILYRRFCPNNTFFVIFGKNFSFSGKKPVFLTGF